MGFFTKETEEEKIEKINTSLKNILLEGEELNYYSPVISWGKSGNLILTNRRLILLESKTGSFFKDSKTEIIPINKITGVKTESKINTKFIVYASGISIEFESLDPGKTELIQKTIFTKIC